MGLTGEEKKKYQREYMKKKRSNKPEGLTGGSNMESLTCPDIIDKLTDKAYRVKLEKICHAFKVSHHPSYASDVWLGVTEDIVVAGSTNLSVACDYLEVTR